MLRLRLCIVLVMVGVVAPAAQQPVFRSSLDLVSVDVVVRDDAGNFVQGLTAADFEVREDGRLQAIETFSVEQVSTQRFTAPPIELLGGLEAPAGAAATPTAPTAARTIDPAAFAGRRLLLLLFDLSSMAPEDVQRAVDSATDFVREQMAPADLLAVATVGATIDVLADFTASREEVLEALGAFASSDGTAVPVASAETLATEEAAAAATEPEDTAFETYNNDARLRALRLVAEALQGIEQKKAVIYFSAGMERSGEDNQVELRAATNAAVRANLSIYPIDTRGLEAVVPGGDASQPSRGGVGLFSGRNVMAQFDRLLASQDSLFTLAEDTGGRAFVDSNEFGDAFAQAQRDLTSYYLIGYSSTNTTKDGRFRRVEVRVRRSGLRVAARRGYYADRDFAHSSRGDREAQLRAELDAAVSATDLPLLAGAGFFRLAADRYYVPIALAIPGAAVPASNGTQPEIDVLGQVRDDQGRAIGRIRDTIRLPADAAPSLTSRQVLYQAGVTLPPGTYSLKVVARENTTGTIGSFETPIVVPQLRDARVKVSSIVLSTQVHPWSGGRTENPLVRNGTQLLPNLTRVVGRDQRLFFYYEVYEPAAAEGVPPLLRTSLAFYRGKVKVFETPIVERTAVDAADRGAALFQFELAPDSLPPGVYTCQINIIDAGAGTFTFPRLTLLVR
ncbi:MAG: VWA domain-containing protein [Vicinamibacterales bacterium]